MHLAPSDAATGDLRPPASAYGHSVDPATPGRVVHVFDTATAADVRAGIDAASESALAWSRTPPKRRAAVLDGVADRLEARCDEVAALITGESGKPIGAARGEVGKSAEQFRLAARLAYLVEGTTYPAESPGTFAFTLREPLGVIAAITPFNFPLSLAARKVAPALAAGNAVLFKPSPVTAGTGELLVALAVEAGLPAPLLTLLQGQDTEAMTALLSDRRVRGISFTGSDGVGAAIRRRAHGQARLQLELGGRNAAVVRSDADIDTAAAHVAAGAFGLTGQACTSTDRILVAEPVAGEFTAALAEKVRALRVGPGDRDGVTTGPVSTLAQVERLTALKESALSAGATAVAEARLLDGRDPDGYWIAPTLFTGVPDDHPLVADEVFGPFASIVAVRDTDDALGIINASSHGLVSAIHTTDLAEAHRFAANVRCGIVKVNGPTTGNDIAPPFGGWKASSGGAFPEGGRQALDFVTDTKTVYLTPGAN